MTLHMRMPRLQITSEAKASLEVRLAALPLVEPRATVMWTSGGVRSLLGSNGRQHVETGGPPRWRVAFYDGDKMPATQKCEVDGVPFCFVQNNIFDRLNGATLQWINGKFEIKESATARLRSDAPKAARPINANVRPFAL